jgi:ABC-type multidrug transport system ATPase subunit
LNCDMIKAEHIRKRYGGKTVLCDVSLHVKQGEIYGLIGKNGSGKTTLLRILTGLIQNFDGTVSVAKTGNHESKISAVINDPALFLNLTASGNLKEQAVLLGLQGSDKIEKALKTVGLEDSGEKLVRNFSLGMIQRLKLAMALLERPEILILDEPVNGLDPDGIADLRKLLLDLNRTSGITILISSHILSELEQIATCFGILHNGEIVQELNMQDALQNGKGIEDIYMRYTKGEIQQ